MADSKNLQTDRGSATCLPNSTESQQFQQYLNTCRTKQDTRIANTFLSETIQKYSTLFDSYRAQYTDLILNADNLYSLTSNASSLNDEHNALQKQKDKLKEEIKYYRTQAGASDKAFLEDIYNGTPQKQLAPTLQDIILLLFWFGWLVMSITLIFVRWTSPGGGWQAGLFVSMILILVTLCIFAILVQVA
jgi:hypothetical protein